MTKRILPILAVYLMAAGAAHAQFGGGAGGAGGGSGGGGGKHGGRGNHSPSSTPASPSNPDPAPARLKPVDQSEIIGVIRAIDPASGRVTIAYDAVDARGWPAGTMPFAVAKTELLKDAAVGEKVRFKLESQQISSLRAY